MDKLRIFYTLVLATMGTYLLYVYFNHQVITPLQSHFLAVQDYAFVIEELPKVSQVPQSGLHAKDCGSCHSEIYEEWLESTHAHALRDIQFQAELAKPSNPKWLCLNCHIPIQNQREHIIVGLKEDDPLQPVQRPNPNFDKEFQQEAITCAVCHVRKDPASGQSYIIGSYDTPYAPHPIKKDREFLRNICLRCHNPQGPPVTENLVCWFFTKDELDKSSHNDKQQDCVDCHMPKIKRRAVPSRQDIPERLGHYHHWVGSGVPKTYSGYDTLIKRGYKSDLEIQVDQVHHSDQKLQAKIQLRHRGKGHYLPTGDPERHLLITAAIKNQDGKTLVEDKMRIGQHWEWSPAKKISDNRLKPQEKRIWNISFPVEVDSYQLIVTAYHVRLKTETARYMRETTGVSDQYHDKSPYLVKNIAQYYPFATYIYRETITFPSGNRYVYTTKELLKLSKQEKSKDLSERDY